MLSSDQEKRDRIVELAERLGHAIGESDRYQQLREINQRLEADQDTKQLLVDYQLLAKRLDEKQSGSEGPSPKQIRLKRLLEHRIRENPLILEFLRAQADFAELMASVRKALEEAIGTKLGTGL